MVAGARLDEPVMTLVEAAGWLERRFGRRPNVATIWRWAIKGMRGVRLRTISLGRYRYTTESAIERFIAEISEVLPGAVAEESGESRRPKVQDEPDFTDSELAAAKRRREAEKEKAKAFLRQNLGAGRGRATKRA